MITSTRNILSFPGRKLTQSERRLKGADYKRWLWCAWRPRKDMNSHYMHNWSPSKFSTMSVPTVEWQSGTSFTWKLWASETTATSVSNHLYESQRDYALFCGETIAENMRSALCQMYRGPRQWQRWYMLDEHSVVEVMDDSCWCPVESDHSDSDVLGPLICFWWQITNSARPIDMF